MTRSVARWFASRPFLSALLLAVAFVVPGYIRQEQTIDEAHDAAVQAQETADQLVEVVADIEQDRARLRHQLCERDVADRVDVRSFWRFVTEDLLDPTDEVVARARAALDEILPVLECGPDDVPVPAD